MSDRFNLPVSHDEVRFFDCGLAGAVNDARADESLDILCHSTCETEAAANQHFRLLYDANV